MPVNKILESSAGAGDNCFDDVQIGHYRDGEGYKSVWYDHEDSTLADDALVTYSIGSVQKDGELYFTVESYYNHMLPSACYSQSKSYVNIFYEVKINGARLDYIWYNEQFARPILANTYNNGDTFTIEVKIKWYDHPAKDYTVKVYSKQTLEVKDNQGQTKMLHMDGQSPSGFKNSQYKGMNPSSNPSPSPSPTPTPTPTPSPTPTPTPTTTTTTTPAEPA